MDLKKNQRSEMKYENPNINWQFCKNNTVRSFKLRNLLLEFAVSRKRELSRDIETYRRNEFPAKQTGKDFFSLLSSVLFERISIHILYKCIVYEHNYIYVYFVFDTSFDKNKNYISYSLRQIYINTQS